MNLGITTPALLFPAISLLLLAYTNRFLALANIVRQLSASYHARTDEKSQSTLRRQIDNLRKRIRLIQRTQELGALSFLFCVASMFLLYASLNSLGSVLFGISIILLGASLALSIYEIRISVTALDIHLSDLENHC